MFTRYMDDILRDIKTEEAEQKLSQLNSLHPNLAFTIEREREGKLPFLDMLLIYQGKELTSK